MTTTCETASSSDAAPLCADAGAAQAPRTARDNASPRHGKWVTSTSICRPPTATAAGHRTPRRRIPDPLPGRRRPNATTGRECDRGPSGGRSCAAPGVGLSLGNTRLEEGGHMRQDIEFAADDGTTLRGWLHMPDHLDGAAATVVMAHG